MDFNEIKDQVLDKANDLGINKDSVSEVAGHVTDKIVEGKKAGKSISEIADDAKEELSNYQNDNLGNENEKRSASDNGDERIDSFDTDKEFDSSEDFDDSENFNTSDED